MSSSTISMPPWRTRTGSRPARAERCSAWPVIRAEDLRLVREPLTARLDLGTAAPIDQVVRRVRRAALGPADETWDPPPWLLPHQVNAARRIAGSLQLFRGAILADAVGLGKTFVALAVATRYRRVCAVLPAALMPQWRRVSHRLRVRLPCISHEALSRGRSLPAADLFVVDEAHRFRNPRTVRYDRLSRDAWMGHTLLITATPVVNRSADLIHLLRLFLPDHGLALQGIPSLTGAHHRRDVQRLSHAIAPLVVARTAHAVRLSDALPSVADADLMPASCMPRHAIAALLKGFDELEFPTFADRDAAELLRLHLVYRLASSPAACRQTLKRHRAYLDRAMVSAARGHPLPRPAMRALLGPDDEIQLELDGLRPAAIPLDSSRLAAEAERVGRLLAQCRQREDDEKARTLRAILTNRHPRKTIVFTAAIATATYLAAGLSWQQVAVVSGAGARIASGPVAVDEALRLFAPRARGGSPPPKHLQLTTLLATDLVSEGLDLQDADAVIHYDLPWSPLRLAQRLGRIARLGALHSEARVWWFVPPPELESRLQLADRLHRKASEQIQLGVTVSSRLGRGRLDGRLFDWREGTGRLGPTDPAGTAGFAVVRGPKAAVFAVRWLLEHGSFPELVVVAGDCPDAATDEETIQQVALALLHAGSSDEPLQSAYGPALTGALKSRLAVALQGPLDDLTRALARGVMRCARRAAAARSLRLLDALNDALDRVHHGVPLGALKCLQQALRSARPELEVTRWNRQAPHPVPRGVWIEAALVGDGLGESATGLRVESATAPRREYIGTGIHPACGAPPWQSSTAS